MDPYRAAGFFKYMISSGVLSRPSTALRWENRPKRLIIL